MISKEKQKFIRSLQDKKTRIEEWLFLVEWEKSILELLKSNFKIQNLFLTENFIKKHEKILEKVNYETWEDYIIEKISTIKSNNAWIAIVESPKNEELEIEIWEFIIVLDNINDPGNLWTIIRICDFYGIKKIIASKETVELTNPKVISSTMWSISRVKVFYTDLEKYFENLPTWEMGLGGFWSKNFPIYWAFLEWENIHKIDFDKKWWFIIIWSESHGISKKLEKFITKKITIPRIGQAESLNAWVATGIIIDNIFRQK